jgi:hypothetical protein
MDRLDLARERLKRAGVRNPDEVLSVTGFERREIEAAKMGVPLEHIGTVSDILENHGSPEMIALARKLGAPYHTLPKVQEVMSKHGWGAFGRLHDQGVRLSKKQRKELVLGKAREGVLEILNRAEALGLRGHERFEALDYLDRRYYDKDITREALAAGVPAALLEKGVRVMAEKGSQAKKIISAAAKRGKTAEEIGYIIDAISSFDLKHIEKAQELNTPPEHLEEVAGALGAYGTGPVKKALSMGIPHAHLNYPANIIHNYGQEGERLIEQIRGMGIPPQHTTDAESIIQNRRAGLVARARRMGVRSHSIAPVAMGLMHHENNIRKAIGKGLPQEKLYEAAQKLGYRNVNYTEDDFVGVSFDFVHFANPQRDSRIVEGALESAGKYLGSTGKDAISREELLKFARREGASYSAFKAFGNKKEYSRPDLEEIRNVSAASVAASQIKSKEGVSLFPCNVVIYPQSHYDDEHDSRTLVIYPPAEEGERLARNDYALYSGFEKDAIASVRFQKRGDTLYVTNLQSGFRANTPKKTVENYSGWKEAAMYLLKEMYANPNGMQKICITPTSYQAEHLDSVIHPTTAVEVYTKFPSRQGYRLVQKQDLELEYRDAPLVWEKKIGSPSVAFHRLLTAAQAQPNKIKFVE